MKNIKNTRNLTNIVCALLVAANSVTAGLVANRCTVDRIADLGSVYRVTDICGELYENTPIGAVICELAKQNDAVSRSGGGGEDGIGFQKNASKYAAVLQEVLKTSDKASVNQVFKDGITHLMMATLYKQPEVMQLLIAAGADIAAKDQAGCTALDYLYIRLDHVYIINIPVTFGQNVMGTYSTDARLKQCEALLNNNRNVITRAISNTVGTTIEVATGLVGGATILAGGIAYGIAVGAGELIYAVGLGTVKAGKVTNRTIRRYPKTATALTAGVAATLGYLYSKRG